MAQLEDLVAEVADPELRDALAAEVAELKKRTKFGLVFERHIPEIAVLGNVPVEVGDLIVRRQAQDEPFRVRSSSPRLDADIRKSLEPNGHAVCSCGGHEPQAVAIRFVSAERSWPFGIGWAPVARR